jgi:UDP-glucuronate 4-epimerase
MGHSYANLFRIPTTYFRFFTVYGPWGRPDMALFKFTKGIIEGTPIDIYNNGDMERDFTYIDDLAKSIVLLCDAIPQPQAETDDDPGGSPAAPFRVVNIGNGQPVKLLDYVEAAEAAIGKKAIRNYMPMQQGDVPRTYADSSLLKKLTGFQPNTPVETGVRNFVRWYREYHNI